MASTFKAAFLFLLGTVVGRCAGAWDIEGSGTYLSTPPSATNLAYQADHQFKAQISSDGLYRFEMVYKNVACVLTFDGTNTIAYRSVSDPGGRPIGADVVVLSGVFPPQMSGNVEAAWMATYLNLALAGKLHTNVTESIAQTKYLRDFLGPEVTRQLVITNITRTNGVQLRVYVPGDATKDGHRVFTSPAYTNGLMFQELVFSEPMVENACYGVMEFNTFLPYREPTSPEDVRIFESYQCRITRLSAVPAISLKLPRINGLVGVSDYSTPAGTNRLTPLRYSITDWTQLKPVQNRAREAATAVRPASRRWLWLVVICASVIPFLLKHLLTRRQHGQSVPLQQTRR